MMPAQIGLKLFKTAYRGKFSFESNGFDGGRTFREYQRVQILLLLCPGIPYGAKHLMVGNNIGVIAQMVRQIG